MPTRGRLQADDASDAASFVADLLAVAMQEYLCDPLAAVAAVRPALVPSVERSIVVVSEGDDSGRTVGQADGAPVLLAAAPDAEAVLDHLLDTFDTATVIIDHGS